MRSIVWLVLANLLLASAAYSQVTLMPPQSSFYGSTARGSPGFAGGPSNGLAPGGYPGIGSPLGSGPFTGRLLGNQRFGAGLGDPSGIEIGSSAVPTPCVPSGVDIPLPPSQFHPPISPTYRAFSDRFAPPAQSPSLPPDACN